MSDLGGVILRVHQMIMSKNAFFFVFKACIIESLSPMLRSIGVLRHCSIVCISSGRAWDSSRIFHLRYYSTDICSDSASCLFMSCLLSLFN